MELTDELAFFEENRARWLAEHKEKFALVKGRELVGFYDTPESAYTAGIDRFGNVPFLVKQVVEKDVAFAAPALLLGLLHAHI